jgi:ribonuclease J
MLLSEGTRFRPDDAPSITPPIPESHLPERVADVLAGHSGKLVLVNFYPRNVERVAAFAKVAALHQRSLAVHPETAVLLEATQALHGLDMGMTRILAEPDDWHEVLTNAGDYLTEARTEELPRFVLSLSSHRAGGIYLHCDGSPLTDQDPSTPILHSWLALLGLEYQPLSSGGHAAPDDVHELILAVRPKLLVPIHSHAPERMLTRGIPFLIPLRGEALEL